MVPVAEIVLAGFAARSPPFALTRLSAWGLLTGFVACVGLMAFGLLAPASKGTVRAARGVSIAVVATLVFLATCVWMAVCLPVLAWMFWIGDADHRFYDFSKWIAAGWALIFCAVFVYRAMRGRTSRACLQVHLWCSIGLLVLFGMIQGYEWGHRIEGMNPDVVAQKIFQRTFPQAERKRLYLVEGPRVADSSGRPRSITYWVMGTEERRGSISISSYSCFWWSYTGSSRYPPSAQELQRAKEWLRNPTNRDNARKVLEGIVGTYPGTKSAEEAQTLLERINQRKDLTEAPKR